MTHHYRFAILMALISACGPLALDAYLPGIPYMAHDLGVPASQVATTVSIFVLGLAAGQLIGGPLSDKIGRKRVILAGLVIYAASCAIISQTDKFWVLATFRLIQAIGGGFAFVCVPALIRDRASGKEAAKLFAMVGLIMVAAPALAPSLGAICIALGGWHNIFYFMVAYPLVVATIVTFAIETDKPHEPQTVSACKRYRQVYSISEAHRYLFAQGLTYSVMIIFVANASFIYQQYYQLSDHIFGLFFGANIVLIAICNRINSARLTHFAPEKLLKQTTRIQLGTILLTVLAVACGHPLWAVACGIILTIGQQGAIMPNASAVYMSHFKHNTGAASALMGSVNFVSAAIFSAFSTWIYNGTLWPVVLTMLGLSLGGNLLLHWPKRSAGSHGE